MESSEEEEAVVEEKQEQKNNFECKYFNYKSWSFTKEKGRTLISEITIEKRAKKKRNGWVRQYSKWNGMYLFLLNLKYSDTLGDLIKKRLAWEGWRNKEKEEEEE